MWEKIRLTYRDNETGVIEILNKVKTEQKILELFETQEIESIDIIYKKREPACLCNPVIDNES